MSGKKKYSFWGVSLRVVPMQFKAAPFLATTNNIVAVCHAFSWVATVVGTQILFDAISRAATGRIGFWACVPPLLIMAAAMFAQNILQGTFFFEMSIMHDKLFGWLKSQLHRKLQRVDPAMFEDTVFLDDLNKAQEGVWTIQYFSTIFTIIFAFFVVYFLTIGAYLFSLKPILLVTLLASFLPALLSQMVRGKVFTKLEQQNAPLRRENEYYQKTLCDREYFKETRILGAFKYFHKLFSDTMTQLTRLTWRAERTTALLQLLLNAVSFAGMAVSTYLLFTATMAGEITVGAFAAVFAALGQIFGLMQEIVNWHIGNLNKDFGKVTNYVRMLDCPERTGADGTPDFAKGVAAENVSFTYPGRTEPAVKSVSLTIADGETIAIVGENGAGKSTMVRLLTGIYRPTVGKVTAGGLDTAQVAPESVHKRVSGVFQKYQRYKMTLKENVMISDIGAEPDDAKIEKCAERSRRRT